MPSIRIGDTGATVFNEDGKVVMRLRCGWTVAEGISAELDRAFLAKVRAKRLRGYEDKMVRPAEDKAR